MHKNYPYAFVTFLIRNDSYLPGALLLAYSLKRQLVIADIVCLVSEDLSDQAIHALKELYDWVIPVESIRIQALNDQKRQYLPYVFTRIHGLRLGADGDLGCRYQKVIILDADILPLRGYQQLFLVKSPGGILNEEKTRMTEGRREEAVDHCVWQWHRDYREIPHGTRVPKTITDRVIYDYSNYGINTALLIIEPSMVVYREIREELRHPCLLQFMKEHFRWPDMQYLTMKWSGQWHNVDISYASLYGFPDINSISGNHYVGVKPWQLHKRSVRQSYLAYPDYQFWYSSFLNMLEAFPRLRGNRKIRGLAEQISSLTQLSASPI